MTFIQAPTHLLRAYYVAFALSVADVISELLPILSSLFFVQKILLSFFSKKNSTVDTAPFSFLSLILFFFFL